MKRNKVIIHWVFCSLFFLISLITHAQAGSNKVTPGTYNTIYEMLRDVPGLDNNLLASTLPLKISFFGSQYNFFPVFIAAYATKQALHERWATSAGLIVVFLF